MTWQNAPAVKAALRQATELWPTRSRVHDGTVGDTSHATRRSDHNPAEDGYVYAFDLTHDPKAGCDAHALVRTAVARRDPRIKYVISEGRIWSAARADAGWRLYAGSNRHDKHAHVSVLRSHRDDTSPWWWAAPAAPPEKDEDEMTPADWVRMEALITRIADDRLRILLRAEKADGTATGHDNLRDIRRAIADLQGRRA